MTTFTVASNEFIGGGREKAEYHPVDGVEGVAVVRAYNGP